MPRWRERAARAAGRGRSRRPRTASRRSPSRARRASAGRRRSRRSFVSSFARSRAHGSCAFDERPRRAAAGTRPGAKRSPKTSASASSSVAARTARRRRRSARRVSAVRRRRAPPLPRARSRTPGCSTHAYAEPGPAAGTGITISVTSSSGASAVVNGPSDELGGVERRARRLASAAEAARRARAARPACPTPGRRGRALPPIVPRLRTWRSPMPARALGERASAGPSQLVPLRRARPTSSAARSCSSPSRSLTPRRSSRDDVDDERRPRDAELHRPG